ncbi:hypothetical protein F383_33642 [Gossypium arboreum]|uniref:Uncharacterized protein n=1 Tax=Gossypium arboreum TaxID=29729 RepID=A0A0B0N4J7_GOSAR|nr:hypothetical protein F383_33642 [Gossypium arboreum]
MFLLSMWYIESPAPIL